MFTVDRLCYCNVIVAGCGVVSWLRFGGVFTIVCERCWLFDLH